MTFSPASRVVLAIISLLVIWLFSFSETLLSMVAIWQRSETFAHGYLIFPISIYLICSFCITNSCKNITTIK